MKYSTELQGILKEAIRLARGSQYNYAQVEHVLLAITYIGSSKIRKLLDEKNLPCTFISQEVDRICPLNKKGLVGNETYIGMNVDILLGEAKEIATKLGYQEVLT